MQSQIITASLVFSGSNSYLTAGRGTPGEAWPPYQRKAKQSQIITVTGLSGSNSYPTTGRGTPREAWPP
jgi:hypothetical protein